MFKELVENHSNEEVEADPVSLLVPAPAPVLMAIVRPRGRGRPPKNAPRPQQAVIPSGPSSRTRARVAFV